MCNVTSIGAPAPVPAASAQDVNLADVREVLFDLLAILAGVHGLAPEVTSEAVLHADRLLCFADEKVRDLIAMTDVTEANHHG